MIKFTQKSQFGKLWYKKVITLPTF